MPKKPSKQTKRPVKRANVKRANSREAKPTHHKKRKLTREERSKLNKFTWQQRWVWLAAWRQRIYARIADNNPWIPVTPTGQIAWKPGKQPAFSIPNKDVDALNAAFHAQRAVKRALEGTAPRRPGT